MKKNISLIVSLMVLVVGVVYWWRSSNEKNLKGDDVDSRVIFEEDGLYMESQNYIVEDGSVTIVQN